MENMKAVIRKGFYGTLCFLCSCAALFFARVFLKTLRLYFNPESNLLPSDVAFAGVVAVTFGIAATIFWITLTDKREKRHTPTHQGYISWRNFGGSPKKKWIFW